MFYCWFRYKQYLMITESHKALNESSNQNTQDRRFMKIVRENPQHLILTDGKSHMIFKTYQIKQPATFQYLLLRKSLKHSSLLQVHKIELGSQLINSTEEEVTDITCGILFEKYQKTLEDSMKEMSQFSKEEIFQTVEPIKQVIQYLISCNYDPGHINRRSIVCSQNYQVKFMENYLHDSSIVKPRRSNFEILLYEQFANIVFNLLFPSQINVKSLKSRYEIAEKKLSEVELKYFQDLYKKMDPSFFKTPKSKKIKKRDEAVQGKRQQKIKEKVQIHIRSQEGKQNKIIQ